MPSLSFKVTQSSVKEIISEVEGYTSAIKKHGQELVEDLAEFAKDMAQDSFDFAEYDGPKDVTVRVEQGKNGACKVVAEGASVYFLEFGAGVYNQDDYPGDIPGDVLGIGEYGSGHGSDDYWFFSPDPGDDNLTAGGEHAFYQVKEWDYSDITYTDPETGREHRIKGREWTGEYEDVEKENSIITHGNPPCAAMYNAFEIMKEEALERAEDMLDD